MLLERVNETLAPDVPGKWSWFRDRMITRFVVVTLYLSSSSKTIYHLNALQNIFKVRDLLALDYRCDNFVYFYFIAKWYSLDCYQVPPEYFEHILHRLGSPVASSAREARHRRQPIFRKKALRLSYKICEEDIFKEMLEEQDSLCYKPEALFHQDNEVPDISDMDVEDAIDYAVQRARGKVDNPKPTSRSLIEIGEGEGRCTREVEFIWWPTIYNFSQYGKLTTRFFVKKTVL